MVDPDVQAMAAGMRQIADEEEEALIPDRQTPIDSADIWRALNDNEVGDADLFARINHGRWIYDHSCDRWYYWAGNYWQADEVAHHLREVDCLVDLYRQEIRRINDQISQTTDAADLKKLETKRKTINARCNKLQTVSRKKKVLELARSGLDSLGISGHEWDRDPWVLPCVNGVVDLRTGLMRTGQPEEHIRTVCPTSWEGQDAACPEWIRFLHSMFEDEDCIAYLQRLFGYAVAGLTTEHMLPVLQGQGRNGKGTILETLRHVLGPLAGPIPSELLVDHGYKTSASGPTPEILDLRGRRLVWASELNEGARFNSSKVKWLTGGDTLVGRPLFGKDLIKFEPAHTLFLLTNPKPHAGGDDYALWQRLHLIEFRYSFVDDPQADNERLKDKHLPEKLKAEAPGILAWLVRGCLEWQDRGIDPPDIIKAATLQYQSEEDLLGMFIEERCVVSPSLSVRANLLYEAYEQWCTTQRLRPNTPTRFGRKMGKRFDKAKNPYVCYRGIALKEVPDETV